MARAQAGRGCAQAEPMQMLLWPLTHLINAEGVSSMNKSITVWMACKLAHLVQGLGNVRILNTCSL